MRLYGVPLALLAATSWGQAPQSVQLVARYAKGEQHRYNVVTAIEGILQNQKAVGVEFALKYTVLTSGPKSTQIKLTYENPHSGKTKLPIIFHPSVVELDKYNRPVKGSHAAQLFASFPDHPVKIGDKWNASYNLTLSATKGALLDVTYKLAGLKEDHGKMIAVLAMEIRGVSPGEGTILVDTKDGSVLSTALNVKIRDDKESHQWLPVQILARREA